MDARVKPAHDDLFCPSITSSARPSSGTVRPSALRSGSNSSIVIARLEDKIAGWGFDQTDPIRMGGYGPPTTCFSRALKMIGDELEAQFGDRIDVKYVWNIMDFGYRAEDILWLVEDGVLSLGYQSSSYLTDRVPELGFVDLPFLFTGNASGARCHGRRARPISRGEDRGSASIIASSAGSRTASAIFPIDCARCTCPPT